MASQIKWIKSKFDDEKEEFLRVEHENKVPLKVLRERYRATYSPTTLTNSMWARLQNTDSWTIKSFQQLLGLLARYERTPQGFAFILDSIFLDKKCEMPIVVAYIDAQGNQVLTLAAGNTRLCLCRLFKIQPKILLVDTIGFGDDL